MHLSVAEKKLILIGAAVAFLFGAFAAYVEFGFIREDQFHGGVLNESKTLWAAIWHAASAFAGTAAAFFLLFCLLLQLGRCIFARKSSDV